MSAEGITELSESIALVVEGDMGVDRHDDLDVGVSDDLPDDVRRHSRVEQDELVL